MAKLFLSFSNRDERAAANLAVWLREHGHEPLLVARSKKQEQGSFDTLEPELEAAIKDADMVIFVVTPFWQAAKLCQWEVTTAAKLSIPRLSILDAPTHGGADFPGDRLIDLTKDRDAGLKELRDALPDAGSSAASRTTGLFKAKKEEGERGGAAKEEERERGAIDVAYQGTRMASSTPTGPIEGDAASSRKDKTAQTLKKLHKEVRWSYLPLWMSRWLRRQMGVLRQKLSERTTKRAADKAAGLPHPWMVRLKAVHGWITGDKRRLTGVAIAGFVALTAVMGAVMDRQFGSGAQVRGELQDVKKRQSLTLTRAANTQLRQGNKETALLLSLEAFAQARGTDNLAQARDALYTSWYAFAKKQVFHGHASHVSSVAFSRDGKTVLSSSWDRTARIWDVGRKKEVRVFSRHNGFVNTAEYNPEQSLIVTAALDNKARLFNVRTKRLIHVLKGHSQELSSARFSPNGQRVVTASGDQSVRIWEVAGGKLLQTFTAHKQGVESAEFSPDNRHILTASADRTARILDAENGRELSVLKGHADIVRNARYSPSGSYIVTAGEDGTARLWAARSGVLIRSFTGHEFGVLSARFSPDERLLVTASKDKTARVWEVASGALKYPLRGHKGIVTDAVFAPDGKSVVTASGDNTLRLWQLPRSDQALVTLARKSVGRCLTPAQRQKHALSKSPPRWCLKMKKRPYHNEEWRRSGS